MRNFQNTFETSKRSFINAFYKHYKVCITVPSTQILQISDNA